MKRRDATPLPSAPASSASGRWLWVGSTRGAPPPAGVSVVRATGVHEALESLAWQRFERVLVEGKALRDRPRAALRALAQRAAGATLRVVASAPSDRLKRALAATGVAVEVAPQAPEPSRQGTLPRADEAQQAPRPQETEDFAAGCLERVSRPGALAAYLLRRLAEVSDAARVSLLLRQGGGPMLVLRAGRGVAPDLLGKVRVPVGAGIAGRVAALGRPVVGLGATGGPRAYAGSAYVVLPLGPGPTCEGVASLTGLPHDRLPDEAALAAWAQMGLQAGRALRAARRLKRAEARSARDRLTRLPNRRAFERALRRELDRARRGGRGLGVAVLDVDRFKSINDSHGHPAGDRVLAEVARRLAACLRESDLVARWGGEEFALLLPDLGPGGAEEARVVVERARRAVSARPIPLGPGLASLVVTISGGVAVGPWPGGDGEAELRAADEALLLAKQSGRDRVVSAPPPT
jgi:diguanylate cyclase (GGDEF)-like protein